MGTATAAQRRDYQQDMVNNIRRDLPNTPIAADPTMSELARYARLAGVAVASWMTAN